MVTEPTTGTRNDLAEHVRRTMTESETRDAADERYNVFAALELDDADVLFVMANRALDSGTTDIDAFTAGYTRAITGAPLDEHPASDAFIKGYEAARGALRLSQSTGESHASPSSVQQT